ncbi:hypothetical protein [Pseudoalteromonas gelatinilytica]|uniref:hypothetical protein n=1 Tax=Pseudoalteromonas gelatinilytica TaxID=1703256 RepID=UPI0007C43270|nr:hypothetical protein [Pseudoalteromonas gelatinilytica]
MEEFKKEKQRLYKIESEIEKLKFNCLFEGCTGEAQKSHSQQKQGSLLAISNKNKEVYALDSNIARSYDVKTGNLSVQFRKKRIASASTFPGFCVKHEAIFSVFEKNGLEPFNDEHACYLSYRTIGYELARQRESKIRHEKLQFGKLRHDYLAYSIEKELTPLMKSLMSVIEKQSYDEIETIWHVVPRNLGVSCSSCISLYDGIAEDFYMQSNNGELPTFTFDVIPSKLETIIVITWLKKFDYYSKWLKDAKDNLSDFERLINRFIFFDSEDICIDPALFKGSKKIQDVVEQVSHVIDRRLIHEMKVPILIKVQ